MTPEQCRAARAIIGMSQDDLASLSEVSKATIANFEIGQRKPYQRTLNALRECLERSGAIFLAASETEGPGVRIRLSDL